MSQNYVYTSSKNFELDITSYGNSNLKYKNCLIFTHGFKGFKDWGFIPYFGEYFAAKGFFVITFNFSHNGVTTGSKDFDDLESFAKNTLSLETEELNEIVLAYKNGFFGEISDKNKIGIVGHSRGGAISILTTSNSMNIDALVTWSAISKLDRFSQRQKMIGRKKEFLKY
jgi:dienelactone hydrolase